MYPILFRLPEWFPLLGGQPITSFGMFMLLAFVTGGYACRAELARMGHDPEKAWDFVFMAVIGGILGAKIYYVLLNWPRLMEDPASLIFSRGGLVWYGGFLGATALIVWEIRRSKLPLGQMADALAAPLAIAYAVGRIGCFMVGDDWGRPTDAWVGIRFPEGTPPTTVSEIQGQFGITVDPALVERYGQVVPVHPTQLYEVAMSTLIFLFLWRIHGHRHRPGWLFMVWLALAGVERFVVELFRAKDDRFIGMFTLAQMISLAIVAVGLVGMVRLRGAPERERAAATAR
jgi:phosphatidylglycerol:prolipoprotein diacylglycerol transferase